MRLILVDRGCALDGTGADPDLIDAVARELHRAGHAVEARPVDVAVPGALQQIVDEAQQAYGRLDAFVACAGIENERGVLHLDRARAERSLEVHLLPAMEAVRACAGAMSEGGSIVLSATRSAFFGTARRAAEAAADAALTAYARCAALELRKRGVRVNVVVPMARTRRTEDLPIFRGIGATSMSTEHAAVLYDFLTRDVSKDVTGEVLGVGGGRVYAIGSRETTGAHVEGRGFEVDELADVWTDVIRSMR